MEWQANMPQQLANFPTPEEYADMYQNWKRDNFSDKNVPSTASNRSKQSTSDYLSLIITLLTLTVLTAMLFVFQFMWRMKELNKKLWIDWW